MDTQNKKLKSLNIDKPTLVLDQKKVGNNIQEMVKKAGSAKVRFRPHFKTHQSAQIGDKFRKLGVKSITVSSLEMALYFAKNGWQDITVAFPANILEIDKINSLAKEIKLNLLVDSECVVDFLETKLKFPVRLWIKIVIGYGRVGLLWQDFDRILALAKKINGIEQFFFSGLLTHFGQSYDAENEGQIREIYTGSVSKLKQVKSKLLENGLLHCEISIGDTPCCTVVEDFAGVDEIRPGNFVFNDLIQSFIGSCPEEKIAMAVACPVVGKYEKRRQIAIYGGAVHFSKEYIMDENGEQIYGYLTFLINDSWTSADKGGVLVSLSQEHGLLNVTKELFDRIGIGDILLILPVHSCLTANLFKEYITLDGKIINRIQSTS